jgi:16S rRNA (cytidine1402-2'-O)-methyltransferase
MIKEGKKIALVSDAGTPGISDPGTILISKCIDEQVNFEVLPGATAITTALVSSGLDSSKFIFRGFLPREKKEKNIVLENIKDYSETIIIYESPHRLIITLKSLQEKLGDRTISICRELTKLHEEILRGKISEAINHYEEKNPRGEYVLVIEGKSQKEIIEEEKKLWEAMTIEEHIIKYIKENNSKKDSIKMVAKDRKLSKSEVYKHSLEI